MYFKAEKEVISSDRQSSRLKKFEFDYLQLNEKSLNEIQKDLLQNQESRYITFSEWEPGDPYEEHLVNKLVDIFCAHDNLVWLDIPIVLSQENATKIYQRISHTQNLDHISRQNLVKFHGFIYTNNPYNDNPDDTFNSDCYVQAVDDLKADKSNYTEFDYLNLAYHLDKMFPILKGPTSGDTPIYEFRLKELIEILEYFLTHAREYDDENLPYDPSILMQRRLFELSRVYISRNELAEAENCCNRALRLDKKIPDEFFFGDVLYNLAQAYLIQKKWINAEFWYRKSLEKCVLPHSRMIKNQYFVGLACAHQKKWQESLHFFHKCLESFEPADEQKNADLFKKLQAGIISAAKGFIFEAASQLNPDAVLKHLELLRTYREKNFSLHPFICAIESDFFPMDSRVDFCTPQPCQLSLQYRGLLKLNSVLFHIEQMLVINPAVFKLHLSNCKNILIYPDKINTLNDQSVRAALEDPKYRELLKSKVDELELKATRLETLLSTNRNVVVALTQEAFRLKSRVESLESEKRKRVEAPESAENKSSKKQKDIRDYMGSFFHDKKAQSNSKPEVLAIPIANGAVVEDSPQFLATFKTYLS